jgi:hypothetical protein
VTGRFVRHDGGAVAHYQGPRLAAGRAEPAAAGTGLLFAQAAGVLPREAWQGSLGQALGGGRGDRSHGGEVDVQAGALVTEGPAGNDCAPLGGPVADLLEVFGGKS